MRISTFLLGLAFVLVGVILFLVNFGFGSWDYLIQLTRLWPVILIVIGLSLFWRGRIPNWLAIGLILALTGGVVALFLSAPRYVTELKVQEQLIVSRSDYPNITAGDLEIKFGGGKLSLGSSTDQWVSATFYGPGAVTSLKEENKKLKLQLSQYDTNWWTADNVTWDINISPDLNWNVTIKAGAAKGNLDLSNIPIRNLDLKLGAGDVDLILGNNGERSTFKISAGASNLKIRILDDTGVRVKLNGALTNTNLDQLGWTLKDNRYVSPNYWDAPSRIDLDLDMAAGNLILETFHAAI